MTFMCVNITHMNNENFTATMTKRTATLVLPDKVDGDTGLAPWLRAMPTDPEKRLEHIDKINRVRCHVLLSKLKTKVNKISAVLFSCFRVQYMYIQRLQRHFEISLFCKIGTSGRMYM